MYENLWHRRVKNQQPLCFHETGSILHTVTIHYNLFRRNVGRAGQMEEQADGIIIVFFFNITVFQYFFNHSTF